MSILQRVVKVPYARAIRQASGTVEDKIKLRTINGSKFLPSYKTSGLDMYKNICLTIVPMAIGLSAYNTYQSEMHHFQHPRPEPIEYEHLSVRSKEYPWGDGKHSLFHSQYNWIPGIGYDQEQRFPKH